MKEATIYETITNFLLDNWLISILVIIIICISAIPPLRDGILQIKKWLFKKKEFIVKRKDEIITFEYIKNTKHFDIVKVNASTHELGVNAEYRWIDKYYPKHRIIFQALETIETNDKKLFYDVITIEVNNKTKSIYFDINDFFNENGSTSVNLNEFVISKIKELHIK
ncbi:hypothetical protein [Chryseobacterium sp. POE27]|uniref:hypothetical protein n=1 Tax=Chryseobacterium sp. POE27 TaxID=3138177 RepID=UPI00321A3284